MPTAKRTEKKIVRKRPSRRVSPITGEYHDHQPISDLVCDVINGDYSKKKLYTEADLDKARRDAIPEMTIYDKFTRLKEKVELQKHEVSQAREQLEYETRSLVKLTDELKVISDEIRFEAVASI